MNGDRFKKGGYGLRNNVDREMDKEASPGENSTGQDGAGMANDTLDSIRKVVSETVTAGMLSLQAELKRDFSEFRSCFREDIKKQMDEFTTEINKKLQDTESQIDGAMKRIGEVEDNLAEREIWDVGVKDALSQLLINQRALQEKVSDLEGRSRRNNIRIYGVPEGTEGTSALLFVRNFIKSELGDELGPDCDPGIERAHRALGPKPPATAPPRSLVIRFLKFTEKEKILHAAWKKELRVQNKRIYFDHDYATEVQNKRKEYIPVKKALKEKGVRFQTPLTKMRVFLETGTVTYNSAAQAAEDLRKRGFTVGDVPQGSRSAAITEETLARLLPWETTGARHGGVENRFEQQIRERLQLSACSSH